MGIKASFTGNLLKVVPKNQLSQLVGQIVSTELPKSLNTFVIKSFCKYYKINIEEAEKPISEYKSLGDFFTRKLKPGVRPISEGIVHPADAEIVRNGRIENGLLIQAKGKNYSTQDLIQDEDLAKKLDGGRYLTYYLCPRDYHRVHSPVDGEIFEVQYIPGRLWPVNPWSVDNIQKLFGVNERLVCKIRVRDKTAVLVMVGATNVGKMTLSFDTDWITNTSQSVKLNKVKNYENSLSISRGDEFGIFHMGSTVIMLYEKSILDEDSLSISGLCKMGQRLSK